jgi:mRNA-degrading endonuclease toxin of MazEF toxin-antitoxin module
LKDLPFYFAFAINIDTVASKEMSSAVLSQIRLIDAKRLRRLIGYISQADLALLKKKLKALLP